MSQQLAVIGLGTMGANLARNAARTGAKVVVYNRTPEVTDAFMKEFDGEGNFKACKDYKELKKALKPPRAVLLMVKAGPAVDAVIADLLPHLSKGDIIIDGGNSHYPDTERRTTELKEKGIAFIGMGVSGGEEGALHGPSMMPGGDQNAYKQLQPLFESMAADDGDGGKCIDYLGDGGAGHFVKMVHNGIEYGIMQLLAESYDILKSVGGFTNEQLADTFDHWKKSDELGSFLTEITADIFKVEEKKGHLIDKIKDSAGQKGTGKWTTEAALTYGVAIPTINAAVDARIISGSTEKRGKSKELPQDIDAHEPVPPAEKLRSIVRNALELSIFCAYHEGFHLIQVAAEEEGWKIDLETVARIWRGGCIIRANVLPKFQNSYSKNAAASKAAGEYFYNRFRMNELDWRRAIVIAVSRGIPVPAMSTSLHYVDALRRERLPQNLIQAQRDYFGAHTYERTDKKGTFHTNWSTEE